MVEQLNKNQLSTQPLIKSTFVDLYTQQHRIQFLSKKQCEGKLENISNFKIMKNTTYWKVRDTTKLADKGKLYLWKNSLERKKIFKIND